MLIQKLGESNGAFLVRTIHDQLDGVSAMELAGIAAYLRVHAEHRLQREIQGRLRESDGLQDPPEE